MTLLRNLILVLVFVLALNQACFAACVGAPECVDSEQTSDEDDKDDSDEVRIRVALVTTTAVGLLYIVYESTSRHYGESWLTNSKEYLDRKRIKVNFGMASDPEGAYPQLSVSYRF